MQPLYLDHAATSPLRPDAREAFLRACDLGGNASSVHGAGRKAKVLMEDARATVLSKVGATGKAGLVFTSGGTEANALALHQAHAFDYLIVSQGEHDSIFNGAVATGKPVVHIPLTQDGQADLAVLAQRLGEGEGRAFVCLMLANNETGVISDIAQAAEVVHAHGGWLHVDAVQALGKIDIDFSALCADSVSLSAHKVGGPQGVGALIYDRDRAIRPLIIGGGHELGMRAGTENIPGIAAFAAALEACQGLSAEMLLAQSAVEGHLKAKGVAIIGEGAPRVPGILSLAQDQWVSNLQLIHMDMAGICVSTGAACSSGKVRSSRIIAAMGRENQADKALRTSAGWTTTPSDWNRFYDVWSIGYENYLKRHAREKELS